MTTRELSPSGATPPTANRQPEQTHWLSFAPSSLLDALEPPKRLAFDDATVSTGVEVRELPWQPPAVITEEMLAAGREAIKRFAAGDTPVDPDFLADWLLQLLEGKASGMDYAAMLGRCRALAEGVEDYPARCFTKATRKEMRRRFQFVPTDKELIDAVDEIDRRERGKAANVMKLLDIGASAPKRRDDDGEPWHQRSDFKWSKAEGDAAVERSRAAQRRQLAEDARRVAEQSGQTPVPTRGPGESDELFMQRLKDHRDGVLGAATADFKRGRFGGLRPLGQFAGSRQSDDPVLRARADAMTARARAEADELAARIDGAAE